MCSRSSFTGRTLVAITLQNTSNSQYGCWRSTHSRRSARPLTLAVSSSVLAAWRVCPFNPDVSAPPQRLRVQLWDKDQKLFVFSKLSRLFCPCPHFLGVSLHFHSNPFEFLVLPSYFNITRWTLHNVSFLGGLGCCCCLIRDFSKGSC